MIKIDTELNDVEIMKKNIFSNFENIYNLICMKNSDYTGDNPDPFANFRRCEDLGLASTEQGLLIRIQDKLSRASALANGHEARVQGEAFRDTINDAIGYLSILGAYVDMKPEDER